ncbi:DUF5362 family protein [Pedobacter sp. GR22-6]|uniref:DUF5362 family protein n=1 Tax=Pedobacter sp. GR22-6 TaxID=3127957 RepID=UPI00307EA695
MFSKANKPKKLAQLNMEHLQEEDQENLQQEQITLVVTEDMRSYLYETAKWARFLAIIGFLMTGVLIMIAFSASAFETALNQTPGGQQMAQLGSTMLMVMMLLCALIYFYPSLMLFKYATATKNAVLYGDQESLVTATAKMKSFFKFWAILTIVMIAFYGLSIVVAIYATVSTGI